MSGDEGKIIGSEGKTVTIESRGREFEVPVEPPPGVQMHPIEAMVAQVMSLVVANTLALHSLDDEKVDAVHEACEVMVGGKLLFPDENQGDE